MNGQADVHYEGQILPICATSTGLFLATPELFSELKISVLLLIDAENVPVTPSFSELLMDGEALLIRVSQSGTQADLAWFRAVLAEDDGYDWYRRSTGLPNLNRSSAILAMPGKLWNLANEKGKVKRKILESLQSKAHTGKHKLVMSGDVKGANTLALRVEQLLGIFGEDSKVGAWKLIEDQQLKIKCSLIQLVWSDIFGGPFVKPI